MKMFFRLGLILFFVSMFTPLPKLAADASLPLPDVEPQISMDFQDANLKDVLKVFSIQSGMNFLASEGVQDRKLTLYMDKVPLGKAMDKLFKANNLSYELDKDARIFVVKDWGKPEVETVTRVFYLKYATVSSSSIRDEMGTNLAATGTPSLQTGQTTTTTTTTTTTEDTGKYKVVEEAGITWAIKKLLSDKGSVMEDYRTNSLVVTDTPRRMENIARVIAQLDVVIPQVLLEIEMLDVSKNMVDQIGVNWPTTLAYLTVPGSKGTSFPFGKSGTSSQGWDMTMNGIPAGGMPGVTGAGTSGGTRYWDVGPWAMSHFGPSIFTFLGTTLTFDFLETQTDSKILARPRVMTLNNETAEIKIATNESVGVSQSTTSTGGTGTTTQAAERAFTGVILRVTPQINIEAGEVTLFVYPFVGTSSQGSPITSGGVLYQFRDPEERSTKQMVKIKDGETIVIGGLIHNDSQIVEKKLPILGDIPIIGMAFRHLAKTPNKERELLVFITPHIIKDVKNTGLTRVPKKALFVPEREQGTVSAANRQAAINRYISNFEK
jgi:type IV pilus assembly protein PilQ